MTHDKLPPSKSPFSTLVIAIALAAIGFALIPELSIKYLPSEGVQQLMVETSWRNATPQIIERDVTSPLEASLALIEGIQKMRSISRTGRSSIFLELEDDVAIDWIRFETANRVRQVYPSLPAGVDYPQLSISTGEEKASESPAMIYSLASNLTSSELFQFAQDELLPQLSFIDQVDRIELVGANHQEWVIQLNDPLIERYQISESEILNALRAQWDSYEIGRTQIRGRLFNVQIPSDHPSNLKSLQQVLIKNEQGKDFRLGDIADIRLQEQSPRQYYRINGQNSLRFLFFLTPNANTLLAADQIKMAVADLEHSLPSAFSFYLDEDVSAFLKAELSKIRFRSLLSLGILLLFVLLAYRHFGHLILLMVSLLINLGLASIAYYFFQVELNLYALAGITVTFGLIMDNTIVMLHHMLKQLNKKVFPALVASTLTTLSALVVVFFLPRIWQIRLADFAQVIMINLSISLLVSWWVVPALAHFVGTSRKPQSRLKESIRRRLYVGKKYKQVLHFIIEHRAWAITLVILGFGIPVFLLPNQVKNWEWYNRTLGNDYYVERVKPIVNRVLGGSLRLFMWYVYDGAGYRSESETKLYVQARMIEGATQSQMNAAIKQVENYLHSFNKEIKQYIARVSSGQNGRIEITFNSGYEGGFPHLLKARIISYCTNMGGISWNVYGVGRGFSNSSGSSPPRFRVAMKGYNKDVLKQQATLFADSLLKHRRVQEVNIEANIDYWSRDRYEYVMELDKEGMQYAGIKPYQLGELFGRFNRFEYAQWVNPENTPVRLVYQETDERDLWDLQHRAFEIDSQLVNIGSIGSLSKRKATQAIHKEDQQYIRMVEFEYTGSAHFGSRYLDRVTDYMRQVMPLGYTLDRRQYSFWGKEEQQKVWLLLLVMGFIFFICSIHFESFRQALAILLLIPISFIGIFMTFYLFDFSFDQGGYTSFILLSGLVVNSLILIITDYNRFRKKYVNRSALENYVRAFQHKITPILLTILSTALGLIPFLIGGDQEVFWFALAAGTIGGLAFSLLVLFFVIPLFLINRRGNVKIRID